MFIAKAGVVTVFAGLTARLGFLQLVQGEEYKTLAADNVIRTELLPAPRGIIYDSKGALSPRIAAPGKFASPKPTCRMRHGS
jgi:cell division protein FtsI/penicillin-binding protein 2